MKVVRLKPEEFPLLRQLHEGFCPDPKQGIALVAFEDDQPIGRIFLLSPAHIEGPWIDPAWRGKTVGARLIGAAESQAKSAGITKLFAYGTEETEDYLKRLGFERQTYTVWTKCLH